MASKKANKTVEPSADDPLLTTNDIRHTTERRTLMRQQRIHEIRQHCLDQLELCKFEEDEKTTRVAAMETELNEEIRQTIDFLDQTMSYYDQVLKQYSPPEERPIESIIREIEQEFQKVYEVFSSGFEFKTELPEDYVRKEDGVETMFEAECAEIEEEIEKNRAREEELAREIGQIRVEVEKEKVLFLAHSQQKEEQAADNQKKVETVEQRIELLQRPSSEKLQVAEILSDVSRLREEIDKTSRAIRSVEEKIKDSMRK